MPRRAQRTCSYPKCPEIVTSGRCEKHLVAGGRFRRAKARGEVHKGLAYNSAAWRKLRAQVLAEEPLCQCDFHKGKDDAPLSTVVDHIKPHGGDRDLFFDRANLRGVAKPCHDRKTSREDSWNRRHRTANA